MRPTASAPAIGEDGPATGPQVRAKICGNTSRPSRLRAWVIALAAEVRVNAVAPGWIAGDWMERTLGDNYERLMARRAQHTPLARNVTLEDVAESVFTLATAHPFVTGEVMVIDGGYAATT